MREQLRDYLKRFMSDMSDEKDSELTNYDIAEIFTYFQSKIERLNNIIYELEKWLEENGKYIDDSDYAAIYVEDIMNKLKELKRSDKE